jgi:hypothetical protein
MAKKAAKKAAPKKAAKKAAKKATKKAAKKAAPKKAAKKAAKKATKKATKKAAPKKAAKKSAKKATAKPAARAKRSAKKSGVKNESAAPTGLLSPITVAQPAVVGGASIEAAKTRSKGGSSADSTSQEQSHSGRSRRSPMIRKPIDIPYSGPPPVPTPEIPDAAIRRSRGKGPKGSVLVSNEAFYRALGDRDMGAIARLWLNDDSVRCTQPNGVLLRGWEEVRRGFESLFSSDRPHRIELTQVYAEESDALAYVSLVEKVAMPQSSRPRREHTATNLFRNVDGEWLMVSHHVT